MTQAAPAGDATHTPPSIWSLAGKSLWDMDVSMVLTGVSMALPGPPSPCALDIEGAAAPSMGEPQLRTPEMKSIFEDSVGLAQSLEQDSLAVRPADPQAGAKKDQGAPGGKPAFSMGAGSPKGGSKEAVAGRPRSNASRLRAPKKSSHFFSSAVIIPRGITPIHLFCCLIRAGVAFLLIEVLSAIERSENFHPFISIHASFC